MLGRLSAISAASRNPITVGYARHVVAPLSGRRWLTEDGYLHKTIIPTDHFQDSLPKLPVPKLDKTLERYLLSATPLLTAEQLEATNAAVEDFKNGLGPKLQEELEANNKKEYTSYISKPWFNMYLENRIALPVNVNPQMTFINDPNPAKNTQAARASNMITSSVRFFRTLRDGHLEPDIFHMDASKTDNDSFKKIARLVPRKISWFYAYFKNAFPLDMSQYGRLFQSTRIPRVGKDELRSYPDAKHVVVQYGSDFYTFNVLNEDGTSVEPEVIASHIESILDNEPGSGPAVGLLTSMGRDDWANAREEMISDPTNNEALEKIDSALFAICLEDSSPVKLYDAARTMLHGTGKNRWFDKSFQLIVAANGEAAVNFEHAWGDGVAVLRYFNEVFDDSVASPIYTPNGSATPDKLAFNLSENTSTAISKAEADLSALIDSVDTKIFETCVLTSDLLKQHKLSPDGAMQMAFQLGHYRRFGKNGSTYESAATAAFKHGRTETIRSATIESDAFCKAFVTPGVSADERVALLRTAIEKHSAISTKAKMGQGWDRHLYALRHLAEEKGHDVPLFNDPAYGILGNIVISTSTLASHALNGGGFGPVGADCFAIGYGIKDFGARCTISSFQLDSDAMVQDIHQAMKDMRAALEGRDISV